MVVEKRKNRVRIRGLGLSRELKVERNRPVDACAFELLEWTWPGLGTMSLVCFWG